MTDTTSETRNERRSADRRQTERESMRTNPEVMGRSEPVGMDEPAQRDSAQPGTENAIAATESPLSTDRPMEQTDFWPPMSDFTHRLEDIQSEFINDPRAAVKKAEHLVEEAVDHMAMSMREHVKRLHGDIEGNADTEKLRVMMRSYRAFIESMDGRRAA